MNAEKTGEFICGLRRERNMTQQELAELMNVSDKAVSRWETGRGFPDIGNLEVLSDKLGVSVAELLKGERFDTQITGDDVEEASSASFSLARYYVEKKKWMNMAIGFLIGAIILLLAVIHIMSPIPITGAKNALSVELLGDDEVVAVLGENVAGYDIDRSTEPDTDNKCVFIGCYDTLWNRWMSKGSKTLVLLGNRSDIDFVYYYPGGDEDELIWKDDSAISSIGGVMSLPRLVYNYWIIIGTAASIAGAAACVFSRKKRRFETLLKLTMIPVCLTVSIIASLIGNFGSIYNAAYYVSGILLLAVLSYLLFLIAYSSLKQKRVQEHTVGQKKPQQ